MEVHDQYRYYNDVKVIIQCNTGEYEISKINTKGIPGDNCGAHLEALTIETPVVSASNPAGIGTKGTVTVIDYHDSVFNFLRSHLDVYINDKKAGKPEYKLLPKVLININCFTTEYSCEGYLLDWSMNFSGSIPSIELSWSSLCPDGNSDTKDNTAVQNSSYTNADLGVQKLINDIRIKYNSNLKFIFVDSNGVEHEDVSNYLKFRNDPVNFNTSGQYQSTNGAVNGFIFVANNVATNSGDNVYGYISESNKDKFLVKIKDPEKTASNEKDNNATELIFVQNGKFPAYSKWTIKDITYCVIPMTSFSFNTEFKKLALQSKILTNPNGSTTEQGGVTTQTNASAADAAASEKSKVQEQSGDAITVKFDCENVMSFNRNDIMSQIKFVVFNENGLEHPVSGTAMVRSCTYTLKGGVVHASVECTEVFGSIIVKEENKDAPSVGTNANGSNVEVNGNKNDNMDYIAYLKSEDKYPVKLEFDKTKELIDNGKFAVHVSKFLNNYGSLTSYAKLMNFSFVEELIDSGNIGLLTLLIGAANYGIVESEATKALGPDFIDAVHQNPKHSKYSKFCSTDGGKSPYSYKSGGLGIAHWDSSNLGTIYSEVGFDTDINTEEISKIILTSGSITWNNGEFIYYDLNNNKHSVKRKFPKFSKDATFTLFDNGLKQNNYWLLWANKVVYYKENGVFVFQQYLFKLWMTKMWLPVLNTLKSKKSQPNHIICLQDVIRISRAKNSANSYIKNVPGKNVATQYTCYGGDDERPIRQKCFCRRCSDILGEIINKKYQQYLINK